ncbi:hypothetical protein Barb7_00748 [Bacteroidales bacterium Barb7]|nr:hypothetical protein Barb7_00748 [Bacteroidales bacterium Barb7]
MAQAALSVTLQESSYFIKRCFDFFGVDEKFLLLFQRFLFFGEKTGSEKLFELEADIVFILFALTGFAGQCFQLFLERLEAGVFNVVGVQQGGVFRHQVNGFQLETVVTQQQVLMLGMDVNKPAAQFFQDRERDGRVIHKGTRLARSEQLPPEDTAFGIVFQFIRFKERRQPVGGNIKDSFYQAFVRRRPYAMPVRSSAKHQRQGTQYNRLPRPGLAGDNRQSLAKPYVQLVYQYIIPYKQGFQHTLQVYD